MNFKQHYITDNYNYDHVDSCFYKQNDKMYTLIQTIHYYKQYIGTNNTLIQIIH